MKKSRKPNLEFDPEHNMDYGYWTCDSCNARFSGMANHYTNMDVIKKKVVINIAFIILVQKN